MSALNAQTLEALLEAEIDRIEDRRIRALVQSARVPVRCEQRPWNYGEAGERYPCWIVLEAGQVGVAYCEKGFGPKSPWGLLSISGPHMSMGDDSGSFRTLEEAARDVLGCESP